MCWRVSSVLSCLAWGWCAGSFQISYCLFTRSLSLVEVFIGGNGSLWQVEPRQKSKSTLTCVTISFNPFSFLRLTASPLGAVRDGPYCAFDEFLAWTALSSSRTSWLARIADWASSICGHIMICELQHVAKDNQYRCCIVVLTAYIQFEAKNTCLCSFGFFLFHDLKSRCMSLPAQWPI